MCNTASKACLIVCVCSGNGGAGPSIRIPSQALVDADCDWIIVCPCGFTIEDTKKEEDLLSTKAWWYVPAADMRCKPHACLPVCKRVCPAFGVQLWLYTRLYTWLYTWLYTRLYTWLYTRLYTWLYTWQCCLVMQPSVVQYVSLT